jgi:hypothetical protein
MRRLPLSLLAQLAVALITIQPAWAVPESASIFRHVWERQDTPVD